MQKGDSETLDIPNGSEDGDPDADDRREHSYQDVLIGIDPLNGEKCSSGGSFPMLRGMVFSLFFYIYTTKKLPFLKPMHWKCSE